MQAKIPVLAVTDPNTDIGKTIVDGEFGWWLESNDSDAVHDLIRRISESNTNSFGINGYTYLEEHFSSKCAYQIIAGQGELK